MAKLKKERSIKAEFEALDNLQMFLQRRKNSNANIINLLSLLETVDEKAGKKEIKNLKGRIDYLFPKEIEAYHSIKGLNLKASIDVLERDVERQIKKLEQIEIHGTSNAARRGVSVIVVVGFFLCSAYIALKQVDANPFSIKARRSNFSQTTLSLANSEAKPDTANGGVQKELDNKNHRSFTDSDNAAILVLKMVDEGYNEYALEGKFDINLREKVSNWDNKRTYRGTTTLSCDSKLPIAGYDGTITIEAYNLTEKDANGRTKDYDVRQWKASISGFNEDIFQTIVYAISDCTGEKCSTYTYKEDSGTIILSARLNDCEITCSTKGNSNATCVFEYDSQKRE